MLFLPHQKLLSLAAVVEDPVPPLDDAALAPLEAVVQRALAKDPADRFDSAIALAGALREASARLAG